MLRLQASDEENKAKSKSLGKQGIILSIVGAVLVIVFVLLGSLCAQNMMETQLGDGNPDFPVLCLIGAIAFYFLAFVGLMINLFAALHYHAGALATQHCWLAQDVPVRIPSLSANAIAFCWHQVKKHS